MILSDTAIIAAVKSGDILIDPFDEVKLGGNSYDVHLGSVLRVYKTSATTGVASAWRGLNTGMELMQLANRELAAPWGHTLGQLDAAVEPMILDVNIPESGIDMVPGILYLASTIEYTETHRHVPYLDGQSSVGRLGIAIHATAGRGDVGFCGHWTLEISVVQPVRVYAGMPIGQLTYHTVEGEVARVYTRKPDPHYVDGRNPMPQPSRLWRKLRRT